MRWPPRNWLHSGTRGGWQQRAAELAPLLRHTSGAWGGEAGVLAKLFTILPVRAGFAVEFGQRNFDSATVAELLAEYGWGALYMDCETATPLETRPARGGSTVTLARERIGPSNTNELFAKYDVPDLLTLLCYILDRYEAVEFPARLTFGTPSLDALFSTPLAPSLADEFLAHVTGLDRDGRGWVDLLLRPITR